MDYPRFKELFDVAVEAMLAGNAALDEAIVRTPGSDAFALASAIATTGEELVRQIALAAADRMLSSAGNDALDELGFDLFGERRNDAAVATTPLTYSRTGTMPAGTIAAGSKVATVDGVEFETADDLVFLALQASGTVLARAVVAGAEGNVAASALQENRSVLFDSAFTVTNAAAAAGGSSRESDADYRSRLRGFWTTARRGTLEAIRLGALGVDGVGKARPSETNLVVGGQVVGRWVSMVVADPDGNANATMATAVGTALEEWRPCGVYVEIVAATPVDVDVALSVAFLAGYDTVEAVGRIRNAVAAMINGLHVGETLRTNAVYEVVRRDVAVVPGTVVVTVPAGDVAATSSQVLRSSYDRVQVNG